MSNARHQNLLCRNFGETRRDRISGNGTILSIFCDRHFRLFPDFVVEADPVDPTKSKIG